MTDSEKKALILSCKTYEEYEKIREQTKDTPLDTELLRHMLEIFPKASPCRDSKGTILDYCFIDDEISGYYPEDRTT